MCVWWEVGGGGGGGRGRGGIGNGKGEGGGQAGRRHTGAERLSFMCGNWIRSPSDLLERIFVFAGRKCRDVCSF